MNIQLKATDLYFLVVLLIVLYKVALSFESVEEFLNCGHSMKTNEQFFPVTLFIAPFKVIPTVESVDEILKCDHSNKSY